MVYDGQPNPYANQQGSFAPSPYAAAQHNPYGAGPSQPANPYAAQANPYAAQPQQQQNPYAAGPSQQVNPYAAQPQQQQNPYAAQQNSYPGGNPYAAPGSYYNAAEQHPAPAGVGAKASGHNIEVEVEGEGGDNSNNNNNSTRRSGRSIAFDVPGHPTLFCCCCGRKGPFLVDDYTPQLDGSVSREEFADVVHSSNDLYNKTMRPVLIAIGVLIGYFIFCFVGFVLGVAVAVAAIFIFMRFLWFLFIIPLGFLLLAFIGVVASIAIVIWYVWAINKTEESLKQHLMYKNHTVFNSRGAQWRVDNDYFRGSPQYADHRVLKYYRVLKLVVEVNAPE